PVADDEAPERGVIRGVAKALAAAPAEPDHPDTVGPHGFQTPQVRDRGIEILRDRVRGQSRDELTRRIGGWRRAAPPRQQVGRDRDEAVLGELLGGLPDEIRHAEDLVYHHHGRGPLSALGIGQIRRDGVAAARNLYVLGVNVRAVEGGRGRCKAVKGGQTKQHRRQCNSAAIYLHRPPPPSTALHRITVHLPLPFAYTRSSADSLGGILSRLCSASSAARSTSAVMSASMSASRVGEMPRCVRYSSYSPIGSRFPQLLKSSSGSVSRASRSSWVACPPMRNVSATSSAGPSPRRQRSAASR